MTNTPDRIALVMGLGRSGTTFLAKLIDTAPEVLYRHEPDVLLKTNVPNICARDQFDAHIAGAKELVAAMAHCRHWRSAGTRPLFDKSYRSRSANLAYRMMALGSKVARRLHLPVVDSLPDLVRTDHGEVLYLIKSVSSLGRAGLFGKAVPHLAAVHIIRHPCAVFTSLRTGMDKGLMRTKIRMKPLFAHQESNNYPITLKEITNASFEEQIAYRWMLTNDKAAGDMADSSSYLQVRYEDLCTDVDRVSRTIFDHLGLERGAQTERFINEITQDPSDDQRQVGYFKVKRPITSAINKWKDKLEPQTIERIRYIVSHSPLGRAYFNEACPQEQYSPKSTPQRGRG